MYEKLQVMTDQNALSVCTKLQGSCSQHPSDPDGDKYFLFATVNYAVYVTNFAVNLDGFGVKYVYAFKLPLTFTLFVCGNMCN